MLTEAQRLDYNIDHRSMPSLFQRGCCELWTSARAATFG